MTMDSDKITQLADLILKDRSIDEVRKRIKSDSETPYRRFPNGRGCSSEEVQKRWDFVSEITPHIPESIYAKEDLDCYDANIENCIGTVKLPLGLAGPLRVNGTFAHGDYLLPLATTEAALVASYHRGAVLISRAGGCSATLLAEGVTRSPAFAFEDMSDMLRFAHWIIAMQPALENAAAETTRHGKLQDIRFATCSVIFLQVMQQVRTW